MLLGGAKAAQPLLRLTHLPPARARCRLGMPDYGLGSVGVLSSSGGFAAMPGMGGSGSGMAAFRGSSTPPLGPMDPSGLSSQAVNLASLGLGGAMLAEPMHSGEAAGGEEGAA